MPCGSCAQHGRRDAEAALVIVNDRPDVAVAAGADGVHLGAEDLPVDLARRVVAHGEHEVETRGTGATSAELLPGVRLVRAFNALSFQQVRTQAWRAGERIGIPIAADDKDAQQVTAQLVDDAGFEPVIVGGLNRAKDFDRGTAVYVKGLTAKQLREALKLPQ